MGRGQRQQAALQIERPRLRSQVAGQEIIAQIVSEPHLVAPIVDRLRTLPLVAVDFETTCDEGDFGDDYGPDKGRIRLIQVGYDNPRTGKREQIIFDGFAVDLKPLAELLADPNVTKVVHYSSFEQAWSRHHLGTDFENLEDTCFAAQSINKELRTRVAKEIDSNKADKIQKEISRQQEKYQLEDGTVIDHEDVERAESVVIADLQRELEAAGESDLARRMAGWRSSEKARLADLCKTYLGSDLPKDEQSSDWSEPELSQSQLNYAAADAAVTLELSDKIRTLADTLGVSKKVQTRIALERERM